MSTMKTKKKKMKQDNFKNLNGLVNGWQEVRMYFNY